LILLNRVSPIRTEGDIAVGAGLSVDHDVVRWMQERLDAASPDLLREMVKTFAEALMAAEADTSCNAGYRERGRVGQLPQRLPAAGLGHLGRHDRAGGAQLRSGFYFPGWLSERRGPRRR
jgi:hypothetical protein